jgi:hypothetical protein
MYTMSVRMNVARYTAESPLPTRKRQHAQLEQQYRSIQAVQDALPPLLPESDEEFELMEEALYSGEQAGKRTKWNEAPPVIVCTSLYS